jgi:FtsH-binding integral membrane protein
MSDYDRNVAAFPGARAGQSVAVDAGLRAHMIRVYNYMAGAVGLTGIVSWLTYQASGGDAIRIVGRGITGLTPFGEMVMGGYSPIILMLATLGLVFFISFRINRLQYTTALSLFMLYAALLGAALSTIFVQYTGTSITQVFFISAASFGALSLYGYTTQRDLSAFGAFLIMGLFGVVIAMIVNIFLQSGMLALVISVVGVLVFAGLTAWDTQKIKEMYDVNDDGTVSGRKAVMGALTLYLDFINLFLMMLRLFGDRR